MSKRQMAAPILAGVLAVTAGMTARGDLLTYRVDPSRSFLAFPNPPEAEKRVNEDGSIEFIPVPAVPGVPDISSDHVAAAYTGTISIDRETTSGAFRFAGGTIAASSSGDWGFPAQTSSPSSYRFFEHNFFGEPLLYTVTREVSGALRDFSFALSSPMITSGTFDVAQLYASIASGSFDSHNVEVVSMDTTGPTVLDMTSALGGSLPLASDSATLDDATGTLTIPVDMILTLQTAFGPAPFELKGQIVATVPEPASLAMLSASVLLLIRRRQPKL